MYKSSYNIVYELLW